MASVIAVGTNQNSWRALAPGVSNQSALSLPGAYTTLSTLFTVDPTKGFVIKGLPECNTGAIKVYTDLLDNSIVTARMWLITRFTPADGSADHYSAEYLGELSLTVGSAVGGLGALSGYRFVDTISITTDASPTPPGMRLVGAVPNGVAQLQFDSEGAFGLIVEFMLPASNKLVGMLYRGL